MRLRIHYSAADEELVTLVNDGYESISRAQGDYKKKKDEGTYDDKKDVSTISQQVENWATSVISPLFQGSCPAKGLSRTYETRQLV